MATLSNNSAVDYLLDSRIKELEDRVFGKDKTASDAPMVLDTLNTVKNSIASFSIGKERIHALWKRLDELNSSLDPDLADRLSLTDNAKTDLILAEEEQLRTQAALLEKMKAMTSVMDSEHTKGAPAFCNKLQPLVTVQLDQKEHVDAQSRELQQLMENYNNAIDLLSQQFVQWDAVITRYEIAAKIREPMDYN